MDKKIIKHGIFAVSLYLITYAIAIWIICGFINVSVLLKPYAYMMLSEAHFAKTLAFAAGVLYLSVSLTASYAKRMNADTILVVLSYCIPIVGLILGIVYRVKNKNTIALSNAYLFAAAASIVPSILVTVYFLVF